MKRVLIWGTGAQAEKFVEQSPASAYEIIAFVDSNPARHGVFHGKPVIGPQAAAKLVPGNDYDLLIIASVFHAEIMQQAMALGFAPENIVPAASLNFLRYAELLTQEQLATLSSVPWWYHIYEILPGVTTPGVCNFKP